MINGIKTQTVEIHGTQQIFRELHIIKIWSSKKLEILRRLTFLPFPLQKSVGSFLTLKNLMCQFCTYFWFIGFPIFDWLICKNLFFRSVFRLYHRVTFKIKAQEFHQTIYRARNNYWRVTLKYHQNFNTEVTEMYNTAMEWKFCELSEYVQF